MEQHPVPQNIAGFQFKLIGDMTVKQFLYLASGVLFGYLILQFKLPNVIKWLLAFTSGLSGFAFAFVPIEERPLDRWLISFFKSIYSPTQFIFKKQAKMPEVLTSPVPVSLPPSPEILKKEAPLAKIEEYLLTLPTAPVGELDEKEASSLKKALAFFGPQEVVQKQALSALPTPVPVLPQVKEPPTQEGEFTKKTQELTQKITSLEQELTNQAVSRERFLQIQTQLTQLGQEKERLLSELVELKRKVAAREETVVRPSATLQPREEPTVKTLSVSFALRRGLPQPPTTPNTISGLVKTGKGAILPGIIVEIKNQEGTPVRAIKTGKLGQFVTTTPLPNGTYTLYLEDPQGQFSFEAIKLDLTGGVVPPLEILAKTQKDRQKEELKKKLFTKDSF